MSITDLLGGGFGLLGALISGGLGVAAFFVLMAILKGIIRTATPDKLLVVTGRKTRRENRAFGFSVERGRTVVLPYLQAMGSLDLGVFPMNVRVEGVNSANGITVGADAAACVCIDDDDDAMLYHAVERLMGKNPRQIHEQIQQTLVGNFRGALNKTTPLQAIGMEDVGADDNESGERAQFRAELIKDVNSDLRSFGMKVVSVSLQKIWDTSNYIANLAQKTLAEKRRQVEIEESRLKAIASQAESNAERRVSVAKSTADEAILAASQELEVAKREAAGRVQGTRLTADQSIESAKNSGEAEVQKALVELQELKNRSSVVLEAEARTEAAGILADGEREAVTIFERARNSVLERKAKMLSERGDDAAAVLFLKLKLPALYESFRLNAEKSGVVDSLTVMNDEQGFSSAVNRGPLAFAEFLEAFRRAFGVDVRSLISPGFKGGKEEGK